MTLVRFSVGVVLAAFTLLASEHALGIMAGAPPDSPAARIDPNTTSSPWSGVGSVVVNGAPYSGVVVAPNFVLTAAHVASNPR